jgi:hypothetical protein
MQFINFPSCNFLSSPNFSYFPRCFIPLSPFFKHLWVKQTLIYKTVQVSFTKYFPRQKLPQVDQCVQIFRPILFSIKLLTPSLYMFINSVVSRLWGTILGSYGQRGVRYQGKKVPKEYSSFVFRRQYICPKPWYACTIPYHTKPKTPQDHNIYLHSFYFIF